MKLSVIYDGGIPMDTMTKEYEERLYQQVLTCKDREKLVQLAEELYNVTRERAEEIADQLLSA